MCVFIASLCAVAVAIRWKRALLLDVLVVVYCTVILTVFFLEVSFSNSHA